ncbi:MAG: stage V sporulation protein E [Limnochordia bacterium]|jgi:cell division protein FtsW
MPKKRALPDVGIISATVILLVIGIVMVFSASSVSSLAEHRDPYFYLKRQLLWAGLGLMSMVVLSHIDYHIFQRLAWPAVLSCILLLIVVLVIGPVVGGSRRWIPLGFFNVQPSELAKLGVIFYIAAFCSRKRGNLRSFWYGFVPPLLVIGLTFLLILAEPDFGTGVALFMTSMLMLFAAGAQIKHLLLVGAAAIPPLVALIYLAPYRLRRLMAFVDPWADPLDSGWNIIQSLLAIGSGGFFGVGLGQGKEKYLYLPEAHTDFIFAVLAEELGFLGAGLVVVLFFYFAWRGLKVALHAPDYFGTLLAVGITSMVAFQALINIGVVTGSLPVTGITLPLISFGGSSLLITLTGIGILLNISRWQR